MAVQERVCAHCGAINRVSADACWRCLESLPDPSPIVAEAELTFEPASEPQATTR
jgi:hypothetical protein